MPLDIRLQLLIIIIKSVIVIAVVAVAVVVAEAATRLDNQTTLIKSLKNNREQSRNIKITQSVA